MPNMEVKEDSIVSFRWRLTLASSEYRCPNGHQWRGLLSYEGGKLSVHVQLISAVTLALVEVR